MYPNFPHDDFEQHNDTCMRAVEGSQFHLRLLPGSQTVTLAANTQTDTTINFNPIFTPNTTPNVIVGLGSVGNITAKINVRAKSITNSSFILEAYTDIAQSITVQWVAIGTAQ